MKDNFSRQADLYAKFRPYYPPELYDFVLTHTEKRGQAWDCATGNGQVASVLADHFKKVYATDISEAQLKHAVKKENISYSISSAEKTDFPEKNFDLITVAQAMHWFDFEKFYREVRRTARPGATLAIWGYGLFQTRPKIQEVIDEFYYKIIGPWWDAERKHVDLKYKDIPFQFNVIPCPEFEMKFEWNLPVLEGYLNTWSSVQKYSVENNHNPVPEVIKKIKDFTSESDPLPITFPIFMKLGRID